MNARPTDLGPVIDSGMCIACGACVAADASLALVLDEQRLMYRPSHASTAIAAAVCPAVGVDFAGHQDRLFPGATPTALGVVERILLAQSTDRARNLCSSSGGLIKELLIEYLQRDEVDGVICLTHADGLLFEPTLVRTAAEVDALPGSIYHSVPFDKALKLLAENEGRFVLVAIPCQLEGIYNYLMQIRPDLLNRIYTTIGLICGWTYTHHSLKALCSYRDLEFGGIRDVSFRGGEAVGPLALVHDGGETLIDRRKSLDYVTAFDRSFNVPRCHLCVNHINVLAEVVVGDAWLARTSGTASGISIVICRTSGAAATVARLEERGRIRTAPADEADIVESQSRRFTYGDLAYAYADHLRARGSHCPEMTGPNRTAARLVSPGDTARFHAELRRKTSLQLAGRYRALRWRKLLVDFPRYVWRFLARRLRRLLVRARIGGPGAGDLPGGFA